MKSSSITAVYILLAVLCSFVCGAGNLVSQPGAYQDPGLHASNPSLGVAFINAAGTSHQQGLPLSPELCEPEELDDSETSVSSTPLSQAYSTLCSIIFASTASSGNGRRVSLPDPRFTHCASSNRQHFLSLSTLRI